MQSPLPWPGGKRLLINELLRAVPKHEIYVEVFSGSATLLFAKEPTKSETINDIDGELVNFFQCIRDRWEELVEAFRWLLHSRRWFNDLKAQSPLDLDPVQRACRFYYLRKSSFAGLARKFGRIRESCHGSWLSTVETVISSANKRLKQVTIEEKDFQNCIEFWDSDETFFYCDPPYRLLSNGMYVQAMTDADFLRLAKTLTSCRGKWLVSHSEDLLVREVFKDYRISEVSTRYTLKGGTQPGSAAKERPELLISNYDIQDVGQVELF